MSKVEWAKVVEVMTGAMYWVDHMRQSMRIDIVKPEYESKMRKRFGDEMVEILSGKKDVTTIQYLDRCDVVFNELSQELDATNGVNFGLDDILFYAGEVWQRLEEASALLVMLGYGDGVEERLNKLGAEYGGMLEK